MPRNTRTNRHPALTSEVESEGQHQARSSRTERLLAVVLAERWHPTPLLWSRAPLKFRQRILAGEEDLQLGGLIYDVPADDIVVASNIFRTVYYVLKACITICIPCDIVKFAWLLRPCICTKRRFRLVAHLVLGLDDRSSRRRSWRTISCISTG